MARGFETGGRQKGSKNERTLLLEERTRALIRSMVVGPTARGGLIALASIIAVCGALLLWVERNSAAPLDFIERHLGFSPDDGDGSMEVLLTTVLVMIVTLVAFRWASKEPAE